MKLASGAGEDGGQDVICIKDMANLLLPMDAYSLVKRLKETVSVPIHLHTHNTTGTGDMVCSWRPMPVWTLWTRPSPPWPTAPLSPPQNPW